MKTIEDISFSLMNRITKRTLLTVRNSSLRPDAFQPLPSLTFPYFILRLPSLSFRSLIFPCLPFPYLFPYLLFPCIFPTFPLPQLDVHRWLHIYYSERRFAISTKRTGRERTILILQRFYTSTPLFAWGSHDAASLRHRFSVSSNHKICSSKRLNTEGHATQSWDLRSKVDRDTKAHALLNILRLLKARGSHHAASRSHRSSGSSNHTRCSSKPSNTDGNATQMRGSSKQSWPSYQSICTHCHKKITRDWFLRISGYKDRRWKEERSQHVHS